MAYDNDWLQSVFDDRLPAAGYSVREEQLAMANFVQTALVKNRHLLAEAGVGTGKTFAYLIPAFARILRTNMPVVVATHTIALQEQLVRKDIPAIRHLLDMPMQTLLAKGKEHYLCPIREKILRDRTPEPGPEETRLLAWARRTRSGDRAELEGVSDRLWSRVNLDERHRCAGCRYEFTCPTANTRRKWQGANGFLVTNHHQFFADMAMRARGHSLFAQPSAIILDEAHALPDAARQILGHQATIGGLRSAIEGAKYQLREGDRRWMTTLKRADRLVSELEPRIRWSRDEEATRFGVRPDPALAEAAMALEMGLQDLVGTLGGLRDTPERHAAIERLEAVGGAVRGLLHPERYIAWIEAERGKPRRTEHLLLANAPRDLGGIMANRLFARGVPVIMTSATLSAGGDFGYLKHELGLENPLTCSVGSPFDYERQARLYMPDDLPDPAVDMDAFYRAAIARIQELLEATGGRALLLYTAKSRAAEAVRVLRAESRFPILHQDRATPDLLSRFQEEVGSVLVGTAYWTGIDVPGPALSCVVVVKLPFPAEDPLLVARQEAAKGRGEDPFEAVLLPEMLLKLKQGVGRLIRRADDRGVIAVLDPRASLRDRYREAVLETLPEAPKVETLDEVRRFLS